jgi:hypothetical protein
MANKSFILQNAGMGFCGNSPYWWAKKGAGYTLDFDKAETFSYEEAIKTVQGCTGSHDLKIWDKTIVEKAVFRTVDYQKIKLPKEKKPKS